MILEQRIFMVNHLVVALLVQKNSTESIDSPLRGEVWQHLKYFNFSAWTGWRHDLAWSVLNRSLQLMLVAFLT